MTRNNGEIGKYDSFFADWDMPEVVGAGLEDALSPEGNNRLPASELEELKGVVNDQ